MGTAEDAGENMPFMAKIMEGIMKKIAAALLFVFVYGFVFGASSADFDVVSVDVTEWAGSDTSTAGGMTITKTYYHSQMYHFVGEILDFDVNGMFFRAKSNYIYYFNTHNVIRANKRGISRKNYFPSGRDDIARFYKSIAAFDVEFFQGGAMAVNKHLEFQKISEKKWLMTGVLTAPAYEKLPKKYTVAEYTEYKSKMKNALVPAVLGFVPGFGAGHFAAGDPAPGLLFLAAQGGAVAMMTLLGTEYDERLEEYGPSGMFFAGLGILICTAILQPVTVVLSVEGQNRKIFEELQLDKVNFIAKPYFINERNSSGETRGYAGLKAGISAAF